MTRTQRAIVQHRQGAVVVEVRDEAGRPRAGVPVWVEQESHAFPFGCVAPDLGASRARLAEVFNRLGPPAGDAARLGVPDGVPLGLLRVFLDRMAAAGETLDVCLSGSTIGMADRDERAASCRLADWYTLLFAHSAVRGVTWNGVIDGEKGAEGGLLRRDLSPKPAYRTLHKLINVVWHTRADGATDADGRFAFRGFYGVYRLGARVGDETRVAVISLRPGNGVIPVPIPAAP